MNVAEISPADAPIEVHMDAAAAPDLTPELPETRTEPGCGVFETPCPEGFSCEQAEAGPWPSFCRAVTAQHGDEVWVPAGPFYMGCNASKDPDCLDNEYREGDSFMVTTPAFAIDRLEVTVADYRACVDAGVCTETATAEGYKCPEEANYDVPGAEALPINCVSADQAAVYCAWLGKVLPSEAMWEKAARGGCETLDGDCKSSMRVYPWGDSPPTCDEAGLKKCGGGLQPVDGLPMGMSPYGVRQMAGNICEWVADVMDPLMLTVPADGSPNTTEHPDYGAVKISKGGSFRGYYVYARASFRHAPQTGSGIDVWLSDFLGFRCARPWP